MPKTDTREYRSMPVMAAARAEGEAEQSYKVRGYATTFNEPYALFEDMDGKDVYEVMDPHCFDDADMSDVIMQFDHMGMVYARTRNGSLTLTVDEHGLMIEADLGLTQDSRKLYEAISTGLVDRMSFCFIIEDEQYDAATKTWRVKKLGKIYDVSAVSIPANPGTEISSERKKRMDGVIQEERAERLAAEARMKRIRMLKVKAKLAGARG
jgi:hypothetical protein